MVSLNVTLPDNLRKYIESRVTEGGFTDPSHYLRALVEQDQNQPEEFTRLRASAIEGADQLLRGQFRGFDSTSDILKHVEARLNTRSQGAQNE